MSSNTDSKWVTFAGGVLLGSTIVAGSTYLAMKYVHRSQQPRESQELGRATPKRRPNSRAPPSPNGRLNLHGGIHRSLENGASAAQVPPNTTTTTLGRTDTELYYDIDPHHTTITTIPDPRESHAPLTNGLRRAGSNRPSSLPLAPPPPPPPSHGYSHSTPITSPDPMAMAMMHGQITSPDLIHTNRSLGRQDTYSESEAGAGGGGSSSRPTGGGGGGGGSGRHHPHPHATAIYAGPADRANPAVHEALRHTAFVPGSSSGGAPAPPPPPPAPINTNVNANASTGPAANHTPHFTFHHPKVVDGPAASAAAAAANPVSVALRSPLQGLSPGVHIGPNGIPQPAPAPSVAMGPSAGTVATVATADALATEGRIIEDAALHEHYSRVILPEPVSNEETEEVCFLLQQALDARRRWLFKPAQGPETLAGLPELTRASDCSPGGDPFAWVPEEAAPYTCQMVAGVMRVEDGECNNVFLPPGTAHDFFSDMNWLLKISALGHVRSFTHSRLQLLEQKFNLHVMLNADKEFLAQKSAPHRDFYNVRKIDTHVHHSACMHQKHLLRFIKSKLKKEGDEVVIFRDGKYLTLQEVFDSLNLTPYDLSVDTLDVHADKNIFHRFDKFNLKYNPFGQSRLREVFIKQDNLIHGRYLAELTREVFTDLEASKYQHTEYRISVYGRKPVEWDTLAAWVVQNRLYSDNNMWMIQVPRLYNVYKEQGIIENFQQLLDNLFYPLFEVTLDPNTHPMLHVFLRHVSGFDLVDDESKPERRPNKHMPAPDEWTSKHNPAYAYYAYYCYANLYVLNRLREARGFNTFSLRPHAGEAGDLDHLASTFLLAENIAHGINLRKSPCLQYLYYTAQVGLCMSPLSNNSLFLDYHKNPFPQFFARGLSVSLSTDDPLQIHLTREPLVEEYSVAAQVWKLSGTDLCEVARNSVLHSGFPGRLKQHWVHTEYWRSGPEGNSIQKTNVPALRMVFRKDCHSGEVGLLASGAAAHAARMRAKELLSSMQDN